MKRTVRIVSVLVVLAAASGLAIGRQAELPDPELEHFFASFELRTDAAEPGTAARQQAPPGITMQQLRAAVPGIDQLPALIREIESLSRNLETVEPGPRRRALQMRLFAAIAELSSFSPEEDPRAAWSLGLAMSALATYPGGFEPAPAPGSPIERASEQQWVGVPSGVNNCGWFPSMPSIPGWLEDALSVAGIDLAEDCTDECTGLLDGIACLDNNGDLETAVDGLCRRLDDVCDDLTRLQSQLDVATEFLANVPSKISGIVDDVSVLASDVGTALSDVPGLVTTALEQIQTSFLEQLPLPDDPSDLGQIEDAFVAFIDLFTGIDLGESGWWTDYLSAVGVTGATTTGAPERGSISLDAATSLTPEDFVPDVPCPAVGTSIPLIGEMGTNRAAFACRALDKKFRERFLKKLVPDDPPFTPAYVFSAATTSVVNYLCLCAESQAFIPNLNQTTSYDGLAENHLDETLSSRAPESELALVHGGLATLNQEIETANATLDAAAAASDDLEVAETDHQDLIAAVDEVVALLDLEQRLASDDDDSDEGGVRTRQALALEDTAQQAKRVVGELLAAWQTAGLSTRKAGRHYDRGNRWLTSGNVERAFESFQRAYRELTR